MSAPRYEPQQQSAQYRYATVQAVSDGLCDLDFGDPEGEIVTGVPVHGTVPDAGDRVMVLLQGRGATVLPAPATKQYVDKAEVFRIYLANPTIPSSWWTPSGGTYDASTPFVTWGGGAWSVNIQQPGMYAMTLMAARMNILSADRTIHAAVNDQTGNALTWRDIAPNQNGDSPSVTLGTTLYSPGADREYQAYFKSPQGALSMGYVIWEWTYLGSRD